MSNDRMSRDEQLTLIPDGPAEPHGDPARWGPRLLRLLDEQMDSARTLLHLAEAQGRVVSGESLEELAGVLAQREPVVRAMVEQSAAIEPFVRNLGAAGGRVTAIPAGLRMSIEGKLRELEDLMGAIARRDEADCRLLAARRESVGAQLAEVLGGKAAVNAYGGSGAAEPGGPAPRFQDREG